MEVGMGGRIEERTDRRMVRRTDEGWMGGWMNERMDGWRDSFSIFVFSCFTHSEGIPWACS